MVEPLHDVELALIREDSPLSIREQRLLATIDAERQRAEATEAQVERLREALRDCLAVADSRNCGRWPPPPYIDTPKLIAARAALAASEPEEEKG